MAKLKQFVSNPASQDNFMTTDPATKRIASRLVEEYAKYQNANDHIAAVNEHLRGPDDAAHLLVG
ncbi:hypothetical protein PHBOTO_002724 [Pseudozyma hubeiensis]|nr:hypothetical protein PHBOTO_002724 [Pseudozyma hubeiensis]